MTTLPAHAPSRARMPGVVGLLRRREGAVLGALARPGCCYASSVAGEPSGKGRRVTWPDFVFRRGCLVACLRNQQHRDRRDATERGCRPDTWTRSASVAVGPGPPSSMMRPASPTVCRSSTSRASSAEALTRSGRKGRGGIHAGRLASRETGWSSLGFGARPALRWARIPRREGRLRMYVGRAWEGRGKRRIYAAYGVCRVLPRRG